MGYKFIQEQPNNDQFVYLDSITNWPRVHMSLILSFELKFNIELNFHLILHYITYYAMFAKNLLIKRFTTKS